MPFEFCTSKYFGLLIIIEWSWSLFSCIEENNQSIWVGCTIQFFLLLLLFTTLKLSKKASLKMFTIYSRTMKTLFVYVSYSCLSFHSIHVILWHTGRRAAKRRMRGRVRRRRRSIKNTSYTHSNLSHDYSARIHTHTHSQPTHCNSIDFDVCLCHCVSS